MIIIRSLTKSDFVKWREVYHFYAEHYQVSLTDDGLNTTWGWLMDAQNPVSGIVACCNKKLTGLAHYRTMPSPLRGKNIGFLDDIVVRPEERGSCVATMLLDELKSIGEQEGWDIIRWITRDNNYRARGLYDKLATKTDWNMYEMGL
ncbi:GNAT family N-acetyltransferase [Rhodospirillaceae bacterium]|jgi:ribosomal protein S18 acetylase RimI-like enzyme|nr:GNAT family N-acetyltransferase [Rhodospirillaceae bacterium]MBT7731303.1 GNAT family N-acetyltransferase [Rhodospirillaceae bacterium]MDC1442256.1 GNAT family N-acetyltransferase [Rhodospirillaceae bacterium]